MKNLGKYFTLIFLGFFLFIILLIPKLDFILLMTYLAAFSGGLTFVYGYILNKGGVIKASKSQKLALFFIRFLLMLISCFMIAWSVFHILNHFYLSFIY